MSENNSQPGNTVQNDSVHERAAIEKTQAEASILPEPSASDSKTSRSDSSLRISLTQLTLGVLVIVFMWQWLDGNRAINDMQEQLARKIAEMDGNNKANQILLGQSQEQVRQLFAKVTSLEEHFAESQNQRAALESLYNDLSASRDEASIAEVEQMLLTASQQLALSANVKAALIALQAADSRLQHMNRPVLNEVRKAINQDMAKLRSTPSVDVTGINLQLAVFVDRIDRMPLAYMQRTSGVSADRESLVNEESSFNKILHEIWLELRHLIRIEDTGKNEIPLIPPDKEFFLRENLRLHLLSARLALLSRDEAAFRMELKTASEWIARFFDQKSKEGRSMMEGLDKLSATDVGIQLHDISESLKAVHNYRLSHESEKKTGTGKRKKVPKESRNSPSGNAR